MIKDGSVKELRRLLNLGSKAIKGQVSLVVRSHSH